MAIFTSQDLGSAGAQEGLQRLEAIREAMRARKLDMLLVYSQKRGHVAYVSGYRPNYHTNSAFAILPLDGNPVLIIKFSFDLPRARSLSWFTDIRTLAADPPETLEAKCLSVTRQMNAGSARIGYVAGDDAVDELSASLLATLRDGLPHTHLEPASDLLNRLRMEKSPGEVSTLRKAAELAETGVRALGTSLTPGTQDYEAMAAVAHAVLREGGERSDLIVSTGPDELALPPAHKRFGAGRAVSCELTVVYEGYWTQICRTLSLGEPSAPQKRMFAACRDAYAAGVEACRPGAPVSAVAEAATSTLDRAGFAGCLKYGLGHGVGLDLPEPHEVEFHSRDHFTNNMVMVVHVGAWAGDGGAAAFVGGPVLVAAGGARPLDQPQREIIEV